MADVEEPDEEAAIARCASWTSGGSRVIVARSLGDGDPPGGPRGVDDQVLRGPRSAPTADDDEDVSRRTAVYGPVRTVVWEGRSRKAPPYPDRASSPAVPRGRPGGVLHPVENRATSRLARRAGVIRIAVGRGGRLAPRG